MANKQRRYDKETGQWVKDWAEPESEKAAPKPDNKAVKSAPENKGA